jgi:SulP family sulfate permease
MLVTFALTVIIDLTVAIQIGVILSAMLFIRRMAEISQVNPLTRDLREEAQEVDEAGPQRAIPPGVEIFEVFGTLFFGAVDQFTEAIRQIEAKPRVIILETRNLLAIDATGLHALDDLEHQWRQQGTTLVVSGIHKQPLVALSQSGLMDRIGEDNVCGTLDEALERAGRLVGQKREALGSRHDEAIPR